MDTENQLSEYQKSLQDALTSDNLIEKIEKWASFYYACSEQKISLDEFKRKMYHEISEFVYCIVSNVTDDDRLVRCQDIEFRYSHLITDGKGVNVAQNQINNKFHENMLDDSNRN